MTFRYRDNEIFDNMEKLIIRPNFVNPFDD